MHGFTLESGACPACDAENSKHIDACHACGQTLPWAGQEAQRQQAQMQILQAEAPVRARSNLERGALMIGGATLFVFGLFLWCGNVFGFYPSFSGAGYLTIVLGGTLFKVGNDD